MNKLRVIDLLNKIANGEEVPKKIKYNNETFTIREEKDDYANNNYWFTDRFSLLDLNKEVEIIEKEQEDNFTGWKMYKNGKEVCSIEDETLETQTTRIKLDKDKKIEELIIGKDDIAWCEGNMKTDEEMVDIVLEIKDKINEIIDKINKE